MLRKIVVNGPESTGKSTLCAKLAFHFSTIWCPEYARKYLSTRGSSYTYDDLLAIAKGQLALEDEYALQCQQQNKSLLFVDTDMYVMKVWCEFVFGKCHSFIEDQIKARKYDLYLLCNIDLEWEFDVLREYPDLQSRQKLYWIYKNLMRAQPVPWADVSGSYDERLQKAINAVDGFGN